MKIHMLNDQVLRTPTTLVTQDQQEYVKSLVPEMTALMNAEGGMGLAANQVGISLRFFIMKDGEAVKLIVNPIIILGGDKVTEPEGCLSIPGAQAPIERNNSLDMSYLDDNFQQQVQRFDGLIARAIQHEVDHLDGKLYIDQLGPLRRSMVVDKHRKYIKMKGRR